jgi:hypothetical protein
VLDFLSSLEKELYGRIETGLASLVVSGNKEGEVNETNHLLFWQSDLDSSVNRNFIEDALRRALKAIHREESIDPVLDRDTAGLSGSPSISESIFTKIIHADVFVADVSIINAGSGMRHTPNPNVLVELGYAVAQLGWDRILLVQNTCFGGPGDLPFDLRGRRVVSYELRQDAGDRSEARGLLQGRLETGLKAVLGSSTDISLQTGTKAPLWWGKWKIENNDVARGGQLFVREVGPAGFLFDLSVYDGAHMGELTAYARLVSADLAYSRIANGDSGEIGEIVFRKRLDSTRRVIDVDETESCSYYRGAGVLFAGSFVRNREALFDGGILNELDLSRLYHICGEYYDSLCLRFQGLHLSENLDEFPARVTVGGVRGLYSIMEGILMCADGGELWVAFIDDDVVRYFTTECEYKNRLPATIENWRARFKNIEVIFHSCVDFIPKRRS